MLFNSLEGSMYYMPLNEILTTLKKSLKIVSTHEKLVNKLL